MLNKKYMKKHFLINSTLTLSALLIIGGCASHAKKAEVSEQLEKESAYIEDSGYDKTYQQTPIKSSGYSKPSQKAPVKSSGNVKSSHQTPSKTSGNAKTYQKAPSSGQIYHIVKKGEILGRIAKNYGVSVQSILNANPGINPKKLKIGQKLIIKTSGKSATSPASDTNHSAKDKK